jgi:hypothetical protein
MTMSLTTRGTLGRRCIGDSATTDRCAANSSRRSLDANGKVPVSSS